jgi:hypothetical protein
LWVLQVLSGIEVLAPELGLRPHLPSAESPQTALMHAVTGELRAAGAIDSTGAVDQTILEWLTVLSRRDVALMIHAQTPPAGGDPERVLLARFAQWWVSLERNGSQVRLSGVGTASNEQSAGRLINVEIDRLCGRMPAAVMKPLAIEVDELIRVVRRTGDVRPFLIDRRFDAEQIALLALAADTRRSAQAAVVAIQAGAHGDPAGRHVGTGTVTIIDTPQGRLLSEHVTRGGKSWMIVGPGSPGNLATAVLTMMRNLPARHGWFSYRKAV